MNFNNSLSLYCAAVDSQGVMDISTSCLVHRCVILGSFVCLCTVSLLKEALSRVAQEPRTYKESENIKGGKKEECEANQMCCFPCFSKKSGRITLLRVWKMANIFVSVQQVWHLSSTLDEFTNKPLLFCPSEGFISFVRYQGASEFVQTRNEGCLSKLSFLPIIIATRNRLYSQRYKEPTQKCLFTHSRGLKPRAPGV